MKKELTKFIAIIAITGLFAAICLTAKKPDVKPDYSTQDSIQNSQIDSVRGEYQQLIDSLAAIKPKIEYRVKWLKERDTIIYYGNDTACLEIIDRKNRLIVGLDSLCEVLDVEARTYSDMNVILTEKVQLEIRRNSALSAKNDSIILFYKKNITQLKKMHKKRMFWNNVKWSVVSALGIYGTVQISK